MQNAQVRTKRAFTLVELLVVVSIIALLISILLPSLSKAREQTKAVVCLANAKGMSTATLTYTAEYGGFLVGPLHPAIYCFQTREKYKDYEMAYEGPVFEYQRGRQLTWVLRHVLGQKSGGEVGENVADALSTCAAMAGYAGEKHFKAYSKYGSNHAVFPFHYTLNNWGEKTVEGPSTAVGNVRQTNPPYYFGWSPPLGNDDEPIPPKSMSRIKWASDEWMIADAWYRGASFPGSPAYQQEGPYQSDWSGNALAYFAPHFKTGSKTMYLDNSKRTSAAQRASDEKSDGKTNTVFMDGHGAMVKSKTLNANNREVLYGFPGTHNPRIDSTDRVGQLIRDNGKWE